MVRLNRGFESASRRSFSARLRDQSSFVAFVGALIDLRFVRKIYYFPDLRSYRSAVRIPAGGGEGKRK